MKTASWLLLVHHDPILDPRIQWICRLCPNGLSIEVLAYNMDYKHNKHCAFFKNRKYTYDYGSTAKQYEKAGNLLMTKIINCNQKKMEDLKKIFLDLFLIQFQENKNKFLCDQQKFFFNCSSVLMESASFYKKIPDGIIASDFYTLLAGVYLSLIWDRPLIYEAHEYFTEETPNVSKADRNFWKHMEKSLLKFTDARFIVTKELGAIAKKELGMPFFEILNAVPFKT